MKSETWNERKLVLLVEDDASCLPIFGKILDLVDPSIELHWVDNAEAAQQKLQQNRYSLIIADYALTGETTGMDLWKHCQSQYFQIPFIIISALTLESFFKLVGKEICPPFLSKPVFPGEARQIMEGLLKYAQ